MVYYVYYKQSKRNWGQHTLGDYILGLDELNKRILIAFEQGKWKLKQEQYIRLKAAGVKSLPPLRRGRKKLPYPTKSHYYMDNPRDIGELKQFPWFTRSWSQNRTLEKHSLPKGQCTIDAILRKLVHDPRRNRVEKIYIPHFRQPRYTNKEEFCQQMSQWAWEACRGPSKKVGLVSHIFYLNSFEIFDETDYLDAIGWKGKALPSDLIKLELHRLLQGFESINDYFRMHEISPIMMDPQAINMTHSSPSSHHFSERLKCIGVEKVMTFFQNLVTEARNLGLIRDVIHLWDGQFHETWLQKTKTRKKGLEQFYGGTYNHGGAKVGVGVYQSTIMDWNGYCTIPIYSEIVPANRNENPVLRETINHAYGKKNGQPVPQFFLADKGPSGQDTQDKIWDYGAIPIIPLKENITKGVKITVEKKHHFYKKYIGNTSSEILNQIYAIRTRIEEHYNLNDSVYNTAHLHATGETLIKIDILLLNCLGVLIPLTAFKIGRPDLMWCPTSFRSHDVHPEMVFPDLFQDLTKMRWDDEVSISPRRYRYERG